MQKEIEERRKTTPYLWWGEYVDMAADLGIEETNAQEITKLLHDTGVVVWHNVPKLRDVVITDAQWLADAMAGVVTFIFQSTFCKTGGITWGKIQESLSLKFQDRSVHGTIISMLEYFEIVFRIRGMAPILGGEYADAQMYFVPSLLATFDPEKPHPALQYWQGIKPRKTFIRRFKWPFFPTGLVPRLLLRILHLRMQPLASWVDAAIVLNREGDECAFLHLYQTNAPGNHFCLEIRVKVEELKEHDEEPLVAELAYVVNRLHRDMYLHHSSDVPIVHEVVVPVEKNGKIVGESVPFKDCITAMMSGRELIEVGGNAERISEIVQDLSGFKQIHEDALTIERKIGEGGFGLVYKAKMQIINKQGVEVSVDVALKEMRIKDDANSIDDFQHEVAIMSKLQHENLVRLYGITKSPLRMVLEYVPESDLNVLLNDLSIKLSLKWRLKLAIDCACGIEYLHSQTPPICHSDIRAPNVFIVSKDDEAEVVAKVADFGMSQQVFAFAQLPLHNINETAPETWDGGLYNEKSDVFSFAMMLWRLFGSARQNRKTSFLDPLPSPRPPLQRQEHFTVIPPMNDDEESEFDHLKVNGKFVHPVNQRAIIRKGGRPAIHKDCPSELKELIHACWQTVPDVRPSFTVIREILTTYYELLYGEDSFIEHKQPKQQEVHGTTANESELTETSLSFFSAEMWTKCSLENGKAVGMLELPFEVWIGTSKCELEILDKKTQQVVKRIPLYETLSPTTPPTPPSSIRKSTLLLIQKHCVWIPVGSEIHVVSTKTKKEITAPLANMHQITSMLLIPSTMLVWVADTDGYISIWDSQTLQLCLQFKIHSHNCAQSMTLLNDYVWMGVGKELIAVHYKTLQKVRADSTTRDRVQLVLAIPQKNQVWAFTRDHVLSIWKLYDYSQSINQLPVDFTKARASTFSSPSPSPPLSLPPLPTSPSSPHLLSPSTSFPYARPPKSASSPKRPLSAAPPKTRLSSPNSSLPSSPQNHSSLPSSPQNHSSPPLSSSPQNSNSFLSSSPPTSNSPLSSSPPNPVSPLQSPSVVPNSSLSPNSVSSNSLSPKSLSPSPSLSSPSSVPPYTKPRATTFSSPEGYSPAALIPLPTSPSSPELPSLVISPATSPRLPLSHSSSSKSLSHTKSSSRLSSPSSQSPSPTSSSPKVLTSSSSKSSLSLSSSAIPTPPSHPPLSPSSSKSSLSSLSLSSSTISPPPSSSLSPRSPSHKPPLTPKSSVSSITSLSSASSTNYSHFSNSSKISDNFSNSSNFCENPHIFIKREHQLEVSSPIKSACIMTDGIHVCTGAFDGSLFMWNINTLNKQPIPVPANMKDQSILSVLDTENGLWCGIESKNTLMRHPHRSLKQNPKASSQPCYTHNRAYHDFYLNYCDISEGSASIISPVQSVYEALVQQKKTKTIDHVTAFWDVKCLNIGQNWEKSCVTSLVQSKIIILLISSHALEEIKHYAPLTQEKTLIEYELAILQNKIKNTPVVPVYVGSIEKNNTKTAKAELDFIPLDLSDLDPSRFPDSPHARGKDLQFFIDELSKSLPDNEKSFLGSISETIEQIRKLRGFRLTKRGYDEKELNDFVARMMEEVERKP